MISDGNNMLMDCYGHTQICDTHIYIRWNNSLRLQSGALPLHCLLAMQVIMEIPFKVYSDIQLYYIASRRLPTPLSIGQAGTPIVSHATTTLP